LVSTVGEIEARPALIIKLSGYVKRAETTSPAPGLTIAVLTLLGFGLRVLTVRGFSASEATTGYVVRLPFHAMTATLTRSDAAPFNLVLLWGVAHTVGSNPFDLRLLPVLFGTATIPMLYLAGVALYSERCGLVAAAIGAVGAVDVWYGQDAGSGALVILVATITIWAVARALASGQRRHWLIWAAAAVGLIWAQWSATLVVTIEVVAVALACGRPDGVGGDMASARRLGRRAVGATALVIVGAAATVPLIRAQSAHVALAGLGPDASATTNHGSTSVESTLGVVVQLLWGFHNARAVADAAALWPLGLAGMLLLLGRARHGSHALLAALIVVPLAAVVVATAVTHHDSVQVGDLLETVPALYLLVAGLATVVPVSRLANRILAVAAIVVLGSGLAFQQYNSSVPELYGYRAAFDRISSQASPGAVIVYASPSLDRVVGYFEPDLRRLPLPTAASRSPGPADLFVVAPSTSAIEGATPGGTAVRQLRRGRRLLAVFLAPHIVVWELS
jgi:Dolichyl-phosphate-mannose-protein mannosyltransferase